MRLDKHIPLRILRLRLDRPPKPIKPRHRLIPIRRVDLLPHLYEPLIGRELPIRVWHSINSLSFGRGEVFRKPPHWPQARVILRPRYLPEIVLHSQRQPGSEIVSHFGSRGLIRTGRVCRVRSRRNNLRRIRVFVIGGEFRRRLVSDRVSRGNCISKNIVPGVRFDPRLGFGIPNS